MTVSRKRHSSADRVRYNKVSHSALTPEQERSVRRAETLLTESEKGRIRARERLPSSTTLEEGPSETIRESGPTHIKGKAPDPRNWGGANLSEEDLDIEAQRAALASF
ncbi:hypothetical protein P692DRAFT_20759014, partial [Suillus brevipes Sb2]